MAGRDAHPTGFFRNQQKMRDASSVMVSEVSAVVRHGERSERRERSRIHLGQLRVSAAGTGFVIAKRSLLSEANVNDGASLHRHFRVAEGAVHSVAEEAAQILG